MRLTKTKAMIVSGVLMFAAACGSDDGGGEPKVADAPKFDSGTTMAKLSDAGKVTVGTKFDQPGFGLLGLDDKPKGFDVEIAKIIAGAMGIKPDDITWKESPSAVREQVIEDGDVDFVVATYTINDERKQRITFAGPYYEAGQQLMVKTDNSTINGPDDLKANPDAKVCSVTGSTPSEQIKPYLANPKQLVLFDIYDKCADALRTGQVDVVTTDNVILLGFVVQVQGRLQAGG